MHWGQKYEELSVMFYEKQYNTKVEDFGCIPHDDCYFLGASPDGIIVDEESPIYGRMLEIKTSSIVKSPVYQNTNIGSKCNSKWKYAT